MATPFKALSDLLVKHYKPTELSWILQSQGKDNLRYAIAWGNSPATVIADLVDGLRRYGEADAAFFQALVDLAPNNLELIRPVAALWAGEKVARQLHAPKPEPGVEWREPAPAPVQGAGAGANRQEPAPPEPLIIRHQRGTAFVFDVLMKGQLLHSVSLPSPDTWPVDGMSEGLTEALRWLLERAWKLSKVSPTVPPAILRALRAWGEAVFAKLLSDPATSQRYGAMVDAGAAHVRITSPDTGVMAWPWEAVRDPRGFDWATSKNVAISRFLDGAPVRRRAEVAPTERAHVLLVSARPFDPDVDARIVVGPLVDSLYERRGPAVADVTLLRPPTLDALKRELAERPGHYTVVHFDTHGVIRDGEGALVLEDKDSQADEVTAGVLARTLLDLNVGLVVMNACRSAGQGGAAEDPFAAVATGLLRAGVGAVVAMTHVLHMDGARQFVPAFYQSLLGHGDAVRAAQAGRLAMMSNAARRGCASDLRLPDWVVPVVYGNNPELIHFAPTGASLPPDPVLPREAGPALRSGGALGRSTELLQLERLSLRGRAAILVRGPAGVGKSALLRSFLLQRRRTGAMVEDPIWIEGAQQCDVSAAMVALAARLGLRKAGASLGQSELTPPEVERMAEAIRRDRRVVVLDDMHFMTASGDPASGVVLLNQLLQDLKGTAGQVLITARADVPSLRADVRSVVKVSPLPLDLSAELLAEQVSEAGFRSFAGEDHVRTLAQACAGLPALIMGVSSYITSRDDAARAATLLEERAHLIAQGEIDRVVAQVVSAL